MADNNNVSVAVRFPQAVADGMKALADIHYEGDLTFEALHLYEGFDESFFLTRAKYMHDVGRYLISRFERYLNDN